MEKDEDNSIWQNGSVLTSDTLMTPIQSWIRTDAFPS